MSKLVLLFAAIFLCSCTTLYKGQTPIAPVLDSTSKVSFSLAPGNVQIVIKAFPQYMVGGSVDYHDRTDYVGGIFGSMSDGSYSFKVLDKSGRLFLGFNTSLSPKNKSKAMFYGFAGVGYGNINYDFHSSDYQGNLRWNIQDEHYMSNYKVGFGQVSFRFLLSKHRSLMPLLMFEKAFFDNRTYTGSFFDQRTHSYGDTLLPIQQIKLHQNFSAIKLGLTYMCSFKKIHFFLNGNFSDQLYFTFRTGIGFHF